MIRPAWCAALLLRPQTVLVGKTDKPSGAHKAYPYPGKDDHHPTTPLQQKECEQDCPYSFFSLADKYYFIADTFWVLSFLRF